VEGRLLVTNQRLVFATPDDRRWQKFLVKTHTVRIETQGLVYASRTTPGRHWSDSKNVIVLGFDGVQKPVAFWVGEIEVNAKINGYTCQVTLGLIDLAGMLESHVSA